ncbi:MAG: lipopolysaccharide biosynthesis protein [Bacteroidales bacterium]|nr:lipopolysaccharide biosynthesis protein [Bacteroidales bacterium]
MSEQEGLKQAAAKGLFWGGVSNGIQQLLNLAFGIFLARILSVDDYGMVGMLAIFAAIANAIQESGFRSALTNRKNITHADYNSVFWVSLALGVVLYIILFFSVPFIADFFHTPELVPLGRFLFLGFLIASTGTAHNAFLFKNIKVKEMAKATLLASLISGVVALVMALHGMAYWGIAAQNVIYVSVTTLMFWHYSGFRPNFRISLQPVKDMLPFSSKLLITTLFHLLNENFFTTLLGRFFTRKDVGYYANGYKWTNIGTQTISLAIENVMQPVMSKAGYDDRLRVFGKLLETTAFIAMPCMIGLALVAPEFISITIGDKWLPSAQIMMILCVWGAFFPICQVYQKQLLSAERSGEMMFCVVSRCLVQIAVVALTFKYGILTMVAAGTAANVLSIFVVHYFVHRIIGVTLWQLAKAVLPFVVAVLVAVTAGYFAALLVDGAYLRIIVKIIATAGVYFAVLSAARSQVLKEAMGFLKGMIKGRKRF